MTEQSTQLFSPGQILITPGAQDALTAGDVTKALIRHLSGDWGDVCKEDKLLNNQAVRFGTRILSSYHAEPGTKFWIITEADRASTTILLPEEY